MNYVPHELIEEVRQTSPDGRTLAVKRGAWKPSSESGSGWMIRLRIIDGTPEEYVGTGAGNPRSGLRAATVEISVDSREQTYIDRQDFASNGDNRLWEVRGVKYAGSIILPEAQKIEVVAGVDVPNEPVTGFIHLAEPNQAEGLFQGPA